MNDNEERVELDPDTKAWFKTHPGAQTTVIQCPKCGLYYKPSLGHKTRNCRKPMKGESVYDEH